MTGTLLDNDILIKMSAYGLGSELVETTTILGYPPSMLTVGRYVVQDRLKRRSSADDENAALVHFEEILGGIGLLEPTDAEIEQAAAFEAAAGKAGLELDVGESQLLSILISRGAPLLATGDKRAIAAIPAVCGNKADLRIACLEQILATLVKRLGPAPVRDAVCGEPKADQASTNCFTCSSEKCPPTDDILAGLVSYILALRELSDNALFNENDLLTLTT